DEEGMGVPRRDVADRGCAGPERGAGGVDRLEVARATRLDLVRREDDADGLAHAGLRHAGEGVGEIGRPVPHADEDREWGTVSAERGLQAGCLPEGDLVERRAPADGLVVTDDLFAALGATP